MLPLNEESTQRVEGVMTLHPHAVTGNDPIPYAARIMGTARVGFLPVLSSVAGRHLIGVITDVTSRYATRRTAVTGCATCVRT